MPGAATAAPGVCPARLVRFAMEHCKIVDFDKMKNRIIVDLGEMKNYKIVEIDQIKSCIIVNSLIK